jgi:AcrR family transcriptional regulator
MPRRPGLDRAAVGRAAAALADERGLAGLSLADLAAHLGVRPPSLYNHIPSLAALHRDLAVLGVRELGARLARAAVGKAGDEAVIALAVAYRAFVRERPGLYAATQLAPAAGDEEWQAEAGEVVAIVGATLGGYGLDGDELIHAIRALRSLLHGFATLEAQGGFGIPLDLDESFGRLLDIFIAGVRAAGRGMATGDEGGG